MNYSQPISKLPKKEQWALIYQRERQQYDQYLINQKQKEKLRKLAFKQALDKHIEEKKNHNHDNKIEDYNYYQQIKLNQQKELQEQQKKKNEYLLKRKAIQQENLQRLNNNVNHEFREKSLQKSKSLLNNFNQDDLKRKSQENKKEMLRGLQYQLIEKDQIRSSNKLSQIEQDKKNIQYQKKKETQRQKQSLRSRKFTQDMKIYDIYNRIDAQKRMKQQQFSKIIIQNPAHIKNISQEERIKKQMQNRLKKTIEIKQSLLEQIQKHNSQKYSKKDEVNLSLYNPLDKIFNQKQKRLNYDKQEYFNFLRQQQEEHKRKIIAQKYMNEQEYKLNLSHLNKVIGQESRRKSSTDRSLMHIGNPEQLSQRKDQLYFNQLRNMTPNTPNSVRNRSFDRKQQNRIEMTPKEQSDDIRIVRNKIQKLKSYNIFTPN